MNIPPRTADAVHRYRADPRPIFSFFSEGLIEISRPLTFHFVLPHMRTRGTQTTIALEHAGGNRECLLDIARWDFHWQRQYELDFQS